MSPVAEAEKKTVDGVMPIGSIKVKENVRKFFEKKAMDELTENIKKVGVLQPLIVRIVNGHAELIAGERRLRAAKAAGLDDVPVRIIDVDDQAALEIQAFENLHRKDLGPIEEARAFKMLNGKGGYDVERLAARVDKSAAYVYRALGLLELPAEVLDLIEKGELSPAHGHQLLRIPAITRPKIIKELLRPQKHSVHDNVEGHEGAEVVTRYMTAKELQVLIDNEVGQNLARAQFSRDVPYAGEPACKVCPKNSGNQGMLFDGAADGRCLDKTCFSKKTEQVYLDLAAEGKKRWPQLEFIGRGRQNHYKKRTIEGLSGNAMLSDAEHSHPVIKRLLAEKPGKLGYAVVLPMLSSYSYGASKKWDKARLVLAVRDPGLIGGMAAEKIIDGTKAKKAPSHGTNRAESSGSVADPAVEARDEFIGQQVELAIARAGLLKTKITPLALGNAIAAEIEQNDDPIWHAVLGSDGTLASLVAALKKVKQDDLEKLLLFMMTDGWNIGEKARSVGVDTAATKLVATKKARAEWEELLKRKCKSCGCTQLKGCQSGCTWANPDLCSACAPKATKKA